MNPQFYMQLSQFLPQKAIKGSEAEGSYRTLTNWARDMPDADRFIHAKMKQLGYNKKESTLNAIFSEGFEKSHWPNDEWRNRVRDRISNILKKKH